MNYSFDKLPSEITVKGSFNNSCRLEITEGANKSLLQGKLKVSIYKCGQKPSINNFKINIGASHGNIKIYVGSDQAEVKFGDNSSGTYNLRLWRRSKIVIGDNTTANSIRIICFRSDFITGSDCMFSDGILIQSADQHGLVDLNTGEIFNYKYSQVILGDHVWLGRNCTLMPNVNVGKGAIVGTGAIVTSNIPDTSIAVGIPARVVRKDVTWTRASNTLDAMSQEFVESFSST